MSSTPNRGDARAWRRCAAALIGAFVGLLTVALVALVLIDPYDTGYFPSPIGPGVVSDNDLTSIVGRGRDSRFNAAIFGNSHGLLLDPARLSPATGLSFVQLTMLGSGPLEDMVVVDYFLRRHADAKAVVIAADQSWCMHDPTLANPLALSGYDFPDWLFADSRLNYVAHMLSAGPGRLAGRRILLAMGRFAPIDPVGVAAYPSNWDYANSPNASREPLEPLNGSPTQVSTVYPAIDRFDALLARIPDAVAVVVAMPPLYYRLLPDPGTRQFAELAACKDRLARVVSGRGGAFLDFLVDSPLSRERSNFLDLHHMGDRPARAMEARIVAALSGSGAGTAGNRDVVPGGD